MKVLWLSHLLPYPPKAGVIQRSYHLIKQLSREFEVDLLAFHQPRLMAPLVKNLEQGVEDAKVHLGQFCQIRGIFEIPSEQQKWGRIALAARGALSRDGYSLLWLRSSEYQNRLTQLIAAEKYDLIHFDTLSFYPYFGSCRGIPAVLDHHNIESHMMQRRAEIESRWLHKFYFKNEAEKLKVVEKKLATDVVLNITCSDMDSSRLMEVAPAAKAIAIPNGVDTEFYSPDRSIAPFRLLFVGTMSWYPNIQAVEFILRHLSGPIAARWPHLSVDIIGAGAPQRLLDLASTCSNVNMHGFVDDIRPFMNESLAFVCPISDGGGTKLKLLDAMAMAMPIIAHPVGCEGICIEDGSSVLFATTVAQYIHCIEVLISNAEIGRSIGAQARFLAETKYSVDAIGVTLRSAYRDAIRCTNTGKA